MDVGLGGVVDACVFVSHDQEGGGRRALLGSDVPLPFSVVRLPIGAVDNDRL
jgi:hypothetical protein